MENNIGSNRQLKNDTNPFLNHTVDFSPFVSLLTKVLTRETNSIESNCWDPSSSNFIRQGTVIVSYTNVQLFPLILLRHRYYIPLYTYDL